MSYIQPTDRAEIKLFPQVDNWVGQDNPVRLIDLIVDKIVMSNPEKFIWKGQSDTGRKSYSPATLLKLFLYGYLNRIASSRRLEAESYRNIELLWLLGELHPDHWTINEYRKKNKDQIKFVAVEFRKFLKAEGYIGGKELGTDGSKFKAYASKEMLSVAKIEKRMEKINQELDGYLEALDKTDILEQVAEEVAGDLEVAGIDTALVDKIAALQEKVEELEKIKKEIEASGKRHYAPNDPDANLMKSRDGKIPGYNGQIVVDKKHKMIAVAEITDAQNDMDELKKNKDNLKEQLDIEPEIITADKGYGNTKLIKEIEGGSRTKCIVPLQSNSQDKKDKEAGISFTYDREKDEYKCSQGKTLGLKSRNKKNRKQVVNVYQCKDCAGCLLKEKCTTSKIGRTVHRNIIQDWIDGYKQRIMGAKSKEKIKERKEIVEHPFGTIKWMMGKLHFILTGKEKVQTEFDLYTTAYNFKRLINIDNMGLLLQKAKNYNWVNV